MPNELIQRSHPALWKGNSITEVYGTEGKDAMHYVMWSGGCDSSLLLYELLDAYGAEHVVAFSYKYDWLLNKKADSERLRREAFKATLKARNDKFADFRHIEIDIKLTPITGDYLNPFNGGLPQAVAWLLITAMYGADSTYFYSGAVRSDDLTLALDSYYQMFTGIAGTLNRKIYLREPYLYATKEKILEKLFQYNLYDDTWFCEIPQAKLMPCWKCNPCKDHMAAIIKLSIGEPGDPVTVLAKQKLKEYTGIDIPSQPSPAITTLSDAYDKLVD